MYIAFPADEKVKSPTRFCVQNYSTFPLKNGLRWL